MAETKYWDVALFNANVQATWSRASALVGIAVGATNTTRIGDRIRVSKITFTLSIKPVVATIDDQGSSCRFVVYHAKQANGALPPPTSVWNVDQIQTVRNFEQIKKFSILKETMHQMVVTTNNAATFTSAGPSFGPITFSIYPNKVIQFNSSGATIAELLQDDYGMMIVSSGNNCCEATCISRVFFTDY